MSWFRKTDLRLYSDERVRSLSPLLPSGVGLWLYLLTGPHTRDGLPGLYLESEAGLCARLRWDRKEFDQCMSELTVNSPDHKFPMVIIDSPNNIIMLPNAIKYNSPNSPNVVRGWAKPFDMIPVCDTVIMWLRIVHDHLPKGFGDAFGDAVGEGWRKASGTASRTASAKPSGTPSGTPYPSPQTQTQTQTHKKRVANLDDKTEKYLPIEAITLTVLFITCIQQNDSKAKVPSPGTKRFTDWVSTMDKIHRIDGRARAEIEQVILFSQNDRFWSTNILSVSKLRKQYSQLMLKMGRGKRASADDIQKGLDDEHLV